MIHCTILPIAHTLSLFKLLLAFDTDPCHNLGSELDLILVELEHVVVERFNEVKSPVTGGGVPNWNIHKFWLRFFLSQEKLFKDDLHCKLLNFLFISPPQKVFEFLSINLADKHGGYLDFPSSPIITHVYLLWVSIRIVNNDHHSCSLNLSIPRFRNPWAVSSINKDYGLYIILSLISTHIKIEVSSHTAHWIVNVVVKST